MAKKGTNSGADLGNHVISAWLKEAGITMRAMEYHLGLSRQTIKKHLNNPAHYMTLETMMRINYLLKRKRLVDIINAITQAPLESDFYVQREELNVPMPQKKRWYDEPGEK